ncbi:FG-GAP-like repeat-containing protein [Phytomonospora endophytica]|uniref:Endonuclease/exonuclease/phosphatase family metal-dependent hydrolase n=1 Tax=Phytomonospora endophytica TaxID=714109 RepID=A0A841FLI0_9ACTN|nr:FG-GAP-like repeat-containing protein [Phytomonospora endophytica]MBB6036714.1 endonuclease/exonuclease/phosphatase family metal-dependent hydrolase [Phytomonospora endophytica]GIG68252.1 hypothetical protein Pen01_45470 [Phytomonospora endophytica]
MRSRLLSLAFAALVGLTTLVAAPAAYADVVTPGAAPPLRFVSYNMCGNVCSDPQKFDLARRLDYIVAQTDGGGWNADQIHLQEVCRAQYDTLLGRLRAKGFNGLFEKTVWGRSDVCAGGDYGMAILVKGTIADSIVLELTQGGETEEIDAPCVKTYTQNRANWACSVHLYWSNEPLRVAEAKELAAQAKAWQDAGIPVVLGGDFNAFPDEPTMNSFYGTALPGGAGAFREADESDADYFAQGGCDPASVTRCRAGEFTFDGKDADSKIDYLFLGERYFTKVVGDSMPLDTRLSDHRLLRGAATWSDCGVPGTTTAGVIRRDATGALYRYSGKPDGTVAPACKSGTGWNMMTTVVRHGDFDGNGSEDIVAVDAGGLLWLYPADGSGSFSGGTRRQIGTGWQVYDVLLAPGDFNGDAEPDLLGRDAAGDLWFYAGNGTGGYAPKARIGTGWQIYGALLAPGDVNGDGESDLIGRDSAGALWFHAGNGAAGFAAKVGIGTGWQIYDALVAAGDVNGDGRADLVGRDTAGGLWFYAGDGAGGYAARKQVGYGFPAGELIF